MSDGHLYPMKNSLIFIQKPILYIKHKEIKYVEFSRVFGAMEQSKSFDIAVVKNNGEANEQFKNIDKVELKVLTSYFKEAGIKMRKIDPDTNKAVDMDDDSDQLDQEIKHSQSQNKDEISGVTVGRTGRKRVPVVNTVSLPDDEDSEEDGNFMDEEQENDEGGEDEDEDMEDELDESEIGKDELKELQSNKVDLDKRARRK